MRIAIELIDRRANTEAAKATVRINPNRLLVSIQSAVVLEGVGKRIRA